MSESIDNYFTNNKPKIWGFPRYAECLYATPGFEEDKRKRKELAFQAWCAQLNIIAHDVNPEWQDRAKILLSDAIKRQPSQVQTTITETNNTSDEPPPYDLTSAKRVRSPSPETYDGRVKRPRVSPSPRECDYDGERSASPSPSPSPRPAATNHCRILERPPPRREPVRQSLLQVRRTLRHHAVEAIRYCDTDLARLRKERDEIDARIMAVEQQKLRLIELDTVVDELEDLCQDPLLTLDDYLMTEKNSDVSGSEQ